MSELKDYFPQLETMEVYQLHLRRTELLSKAPGGDYAQLPDDILTELLAINRVLRKKQSGPPKQAKASKGPVTIDSLA